MLLRERSVALAYRTSDVDDKPRVNLKASIRFRVHPEKRKWEVACALTAPSQQRTHALQQKSRLFDHLVGAKQERVRDCQPKRLGGLEVQDQLVFRRQLHREIARLLAAQDAIDISGGATKDVYLVDSVGEQAAVSGKVREPIDGRYVVSGCR